MRLLTCAMFQSQINLKTLRAKKSTTRAMPDARGAHSTLSVDDVLHVIVLSSIDPNEPVDNWAPYAAQLYTACGVLLTPHDVQKRYFTILSQCGGFASAKKRAEELKVDLQQAMHSHGKRQHPTAAASSVQGQGRTVSAASPQAPYLASSAPAGGPATSSSSSISVAADHLLDVVNMFRAVEGFDVFEEPVGPRVVNTVMSQHNYGMVIKQPVSISLMRSLIREGKITTITELEQYIWKMAANCVFFNVPEGPYPGLARRFAKECSAIIHRELLR